MPTFTFNNLLDMVTDTPYDESGVAFNPVTGRATAGAYRYYSTTHGAFAQDQWKVTPKLTLTVGIRWDNFGNTKPANGTILSNILLGPGQTIDQQIANASVRQVSGSFANSLSNNWSPRGGVAWDPTGRGNWVIRGGFGFFRDWPTLSRSEGGLTGNPPFLLFPDFRVGTSELPRFSLGTSNTYPFGYAYPSVPPAVFDQRGGIVGLPLNVGGIDRNLRTPATKNWSIGVEHQVGAGFVAGFNYAGSHISGNFDDGIYFPAPDFNRFAGDLLDGKLNRLNPSFQQMAYNTNYDNVNYNALILTVRRRLSARGTFQASYTFSKVTDYGLNWPDQHNLSQWSGPADWDARHHFSLTGFYELPGLANKPALVHRILGNWEITSTTLLQSGMPYTVNTSAPFAPLLNSAGQVTGFAPGSGDFNADGYNFDYPNTTAALHSACNNGSKGALLSGLFSSSSFPLPTPGTEGNEKRNSCRGPSFEEVDIGLIKNNQIYERVNLQLRVEAFNVFNRVNLNGVDSNMADGTFGKSISTFNPRTIQLGVRVTF